MRCTAGCVRSSRAGIERSPIADPEGDHGRSEAEQNRGCKRNTQREEHDRQVGCRAHRDVAVPLGDKRDQCFGGEKSRSHPEGAASQRVIAPIRVEGGFVTAYDHTADEVRTYPLHRITGVAELAED